MGHIFRELGILTFLNISAITALPARTLGTRLRCRTDDDGLSGEGRHFQHVHPLAGGGFNACGASRPRPAAGGLLDIRKTAGMANHLGLYSEETSLCGEACGNFPKRSPTWG